MIEFRVACIWSPCSSQHQDLAAILQYDEGFILLSKPDGVFTFWAWMSVAGPQQLGGTILLFSFMFRTLVSANLTILHSELDCDTPSSSSHYAKCWFPCSHSGSDTCKDLASRQREYCSSVALKSSPSVLFHHDPSKPSSSSAPALSKFQYLSASWQLLLSGHLTKFIWHLDVIAETGRLSPKKFHD